MKKYFQHIGRRQYIVFASIVGALLLAVVIGVCVYYHKRDAMLLSAIEGAKSKLERDYSLHLEIDSAYFSGFKTVTVEGVSITPEARERLLGMEKGSVSIRLWPLIGGDMKLSRLSVSDTKLTFIKQDSISNFDFIFANREVDRAKTTAEDTGINLSHRIEGFINKLLSNIPRNMTIREFMVSYAKDSTYQQVNIPIADVSGGNISAAVHLNDRDAWQVSGKVNPNRQQVSVKVHANGEQIEVPFLKGKYGLAAGFNSLEARLEDVFWADDELHIKGELGVHDLKLNHWRIAQQDITIQNATMAAELIVGSNYLELAETSAVQVKNLVVNPYFRYTKTPTETYAFRLKTPELDAQDLFDAFPRGLFETLDGIRVSGQIQYDMDVFLDTENPDSVRFSSTMNEKNFVVNAWGGAHLAELNTAFPHTIYEDDDAVREVVVGPEYRDFVPLAQISPHLRNAILTTEDPSFYEHDGFVEEAFRSSIAINYKEKAFVRGASTISMQLVKNLYLNRNKTVVRKIEEILVVWLMETTRTVSKDRMYEIYLNIIEFGRNVYGISEASRYYFGKTPDQLNIGESIYLASIVPKPKTGLYAFQYDGSLKPYLSKYFNYIGNIMAKRGLAPYDGENSYGFYAVSLRPALRPAKPAEVDTMDFEPGREIIEEIPQTDRRNIFQRIFGSGDKEN